MKNVLLTSALLAVSALSFSAQAAPVTVEFKGVNPNDIGQNDNSGQTSALLKSHMFNSSGQLVLGHGYVIETFDRATAMVNAAGEKVGNPQVVSGGGIEIRGNGCSFNSYGSVGIGVTGGGFTALQGSTTGAAAPAGNTSCYGAAPQPGGGANTASMTISYAGLLTGDDYINYLGLYYGSIDTYNNLYFYSDDLGTKLVATVTGQSILTAMKGVSGDQLGEGSNVYVNLYFDASAGFRSFKFETTGIAVEVDNIVVGFASRPNQEVPEPGSLALLGAGLAALGLGRRRLAKKA